MKKHKFSDKLPKNGTTILCYIWQKNPTACRYGIFNVFYFDSGIKLEANIDFINILDDIWPMVFKIYFDEDTSDKLTWWADLEGED